MARKGHPDLAIWQTLLQRLEQSLGRDTHHGSERHLREKESHLAVEAALKTALSAGNPNGNQQPA